MVLCGSLNGSLTKKFLVNSSPRVCNVEGSWVNIVLMRQETSLFILTRLETKNLSSELVIHNMTHCPIDMTLKIGHRKTHNVFKWTPVLYEPLWLHFSRALRPSWSRMVWFLVLSCPFWSSKVLSGPAKSCTVIYSQITTYTNLLNPYQTQHFIS